MHGGRILSTLSYAGGGDVVSKFGIFEVNFGNFSSEPKTVRNERFCKEMLMGFEGQKSFDFFKTSSWAQGLFGTCYQFLLNWLFCLTGSFGHGLTCLLWS